MPTEEFTGQVAVAAAPAQVRDHLVRPESYIGLSPLIVAVRDIVHTAGETRYVSVERFRLGPLHYDNLIRVTMTTPAPLRIVSDVRSPGRVHLVATVDLTPAGTGTRVTETIRVTYPRLLRAFVIDQATKVQRHRGAELTRRMAAL